VKAAVTGRKELLALREGGYGDLVLAMAVTSWLGEHAMRPFIVWM
jgi:hypothetical protein